MKKNPKTLVIIGFFVLFVLYGLFEMIKLLLGPRLIVQTPAKYQTFDTPLIHVTGIVERGDFISINDRQIFVDTKGSFNTELLLPPEYSIITVKVRDRFGREVFDKIPVYYVKKIEEMKELDIASTSATTTDTLKTNKK